jgi:hypothetical protein
MKYDLNDLKNDIMFYSIVILLSPFILYARMRRKDEEQRN